MVGEGVLKGLRLGASAMSLAVTASRCPTGSASFTSPDVLGVGRRPTRGRPPAHPLSHWKVPVMVMGKVSVTRVRLLAAVHSVQLMLAVPRIATVAVPSANAA